MSDIEEQGVNSDKPESISHLVSSTSTYIQDSDVEHALSEEAINDCDSTTEVTESHQENNFGSSSQSCDDSTLHSVDKTESSSVEEPPPEFNDTPRTSRELKSILALSKEARLDTNLTTHRRTAIDKKTMVKKNSKITTFPVTAESELENFDENVETVKKIIKSRKSSVEGAGNEEIKSAHGLTGEFVMVRKANKDKFCWRCHHEAVQVACETCPRAYHLKCLKQTIADVEHWPCPECVSILKAENTQTRSKAMKGMSLEHLCSLLKFAVKRMIQCAGSEPFINTVDERQFPEYRSYIIQPMTLTILETNIKHNLYGSTQAFEADAKWIMHNSIVFNSSLSDQSKLTTAAKTILKICKQEMAEIENCPSCYENANTKKHTWFVEVCPRPHLLVWAKLKGFPYWPAKVMSVNGAGMADVRFFGAHDKAWVSVKDCYLYSVKDPNSGKQKRNDIIECVKELELYVDNLRKVFGRVNFAPFKTILEADSQLKQLRVFLPNWMNNGKDMVIRKVKESGRMEKTLSKRSENLENVDGEESTDDSDKDEEDDEREDDEEQNNADDVDGEKISLKERSMTRIDYRECSSPESPKGTSKPTKATFARKRHSTDSSQEACSKIAKRDVGKTSTDLKAMGSTTKPPNKGAANEANKQSTSPSKLRIADQLIKKLEELDETADGTGELESKSVGKNNDVEENVPEECGIEKIDENNSNKSRRYDGDDETSKEMSGESNEEKVNIVEIDDSPENVNDMVGTLDGACIHNPVHSTVIKAKGDDAPSEVGKKRRHEDLKYDDKSEKIEDTNAFPPNKMVKLVPIENILQKKSTAETSGNKSEQLIVLKEIRVVKNGKEIKENDSTQQEATKEVQVTVKNEVDSDEDNSDVQYMEAKRQYLSALNISEKQSIPSKPKAHEIRTRSKTEEKKSKSSENLTRAAEDVGSRSGEVSKSIEPAKEIYIKSLSKMQTPKHKARKSFPTPNYGKKTIVARKLIPKPGPDEEVAIVNSTTLQPTGNVMRLPKLHYTRPLPASREISSPPVLTLLPRMSLDLPRKISEGSQNYIPQNEGEGRNRAGGTLLNNLLTSGSGTISAQPIIEVDGQTNQIDSELGALKEILPEVVSKGVNDILCQPPPKLKPKPLGILSNDVESGVPSTAGPVASRINSMTQKLGDYFRGLLIETIGDLGKSNNPEATISSLKYEIEELNHKHNIELSEIRRNVSIVLKDIQKSVVEERERIINETKANCEMEMMKRVEEAKSKQWCANCLKEAQFYCCWNTSYCDYPCQQKHWLKHMTKCTQTAGQNQTATSTPVRPAAQQLVLTPTSAPKFGALFAKPQKVYLKRASTPFKQATGGHITLVESTPGNFELLGSGPIAVNGKILASTSVIEKIKSGNIVTVTAPSATTNTQLTSANQKMVPLLKSTASSSESEQ